MLVGKLTAFQIQVGFCMDRAESNVRKGYDQFDDTMPFSEY